jgi:lipopolysaccharide/colanic/teichoic acid biosynthesis glycosyltransferase
MSIMRPRAHRIAMKAAERLYHEAVTDYHRIKPGIAGWAQVCGLRGENHSVEKGKRRLDLDLYSIDNWSPLFDIYIMMRSFCVILDMKGAYQDARNAGKIKRR